jgi:hypothetical protein
VGRLAAPRRNRVNVEVQGARRRGMQSEPRDARLLEGLPQGDRLAAGLAGLGVPSRLKPALELPMMEKQRAIAGSREDEGARREVSLGDPPIEGIRVGRDEREDTIAVASLLLVGAPMTAKHIGQSGQRAATPALLTASACLRQQAPRGLRRRFRPLPSRRGSGRGGCCAASSAFPARSAAGFRRPSARGRDAS